MYEPFPAGNKEFLSEKERDFLDETVHDWRDGKLQKADEGHGSQQKRCDHEGGNRHI